MAIDQNIKVATLGALGLITLGLFVFVFSRARGGASRSALDGPAEGSPHEDTHDEGLVKGKKDVDGQPGPPDPRISSKPSQSVAKGSGGTVSNGDGGAGGKLDSNGTGAGASPAPMPSRGEQDGGAGEVEREERRELVARFNQANNLAKKYFKGQRYEQAAEQYGIALEICDRLPNHEEKRVALYNNRGAAFEKAGKYAQSLAECTLCLARDPGHNLARVRKSRVLEALGKPNEALAEVCAHLLLERDRVQARAALNPTQPIQPPPPPANLESLLHKVASERADKVLEQRAAEASAAGTGEDGAGTKRKLKPLPRQAVADLLRSFGSFAQIQREFKGVSEDTLTQQVEGGTRSEGEESPEDPPASTPARVSTLLDRCRLRLVKRDFEGARQDVYEAAEHLTKLQAEATEEGSGVTFAVEVAVWEWQGTFLQIETQLDQAMAAYERCCAAAEREGLQVPTDVLIKIAWVYMDKEDTKKAETYFTRAIESDPEYGSVYAHRARLYADSEGSEVVKGYLDKALALNPKDLFSWEQIARIYVAGDELEKALKTAEDGIKAVPRGETLLTLKAELKYMLATKRGDSSEAMEMVNLFNEAIRADPNSMVVYLNKAMFVLQMMQDVAGATQLLEKAVSVDPTCVTAMLQLANLKIMVAKSLDDAREAASLLQEAVEVCNTRDELVETMSVLVATEARIQGALLLGRTSLG